MRGRGSHLRGNYEDGRGQGVGRAAGGDSQGQSEWTEVGRATRGRGDHSRGGHDGGRRGRGRGDAGGEGQGLFEVGRGSRGRGGYSRGGFDDGDGRGRGGLQIQGQPESSRGYMSRGGSSRGMYDDGRRGQMQAQGGNRGGQSGAGRRLPPSVYPFAQGESMDARLSTDAQDSLIRNIKGLTLQGNRVFRPGWGTLGGEIKVRANFFALKYQPHSVLYEYTVKFEPNLESSAMRKRLFELLEQEQVLSRFMTDIVHDGTQRIISCALLPLELPLLIQIAYYDSHEDGPRSRAPVITVSLEPPKELRTDDLDKYVHCIQSHSR